MVEAKGGRLYLRQHFLPLGLSPLRWSTQHLGSKLPWRSCRQVYRGWNKRPDILNTTYVRVETQVEHLIRHPNESAPSCNNSSGPLPLG
jgi:hypothetical protein